MSVTGLEPTLERVLDLGGVFVFALSGASLAARKGFDLVGIAVLAMATGLGGGLLRDLLLDVHPPAAFDDRLYLWVPVLATAVVVIGGGIVRRIERPVLLFDAGGLGLFCVLGTAKALGLGLGVGPAVLLGTTTAVGGGVIRDVLARDVPSIFRADSALYAIPATLGSAATGAAWSADAFGAFAAITIAGAVLGLRLLAMHFHWRAPTARTEATSGYDGGRD